MDFEAEGGEDTILAEKESSDLTDDETLMPLPDAIHGESIQFYLRKEDLGMLQSEGWAIYDENHSGKLQIDTAPLYEGPQGPTKAAAAFTDRALAIFYFCLPEGLWRRIANETNCEPFDETNRYRLCPVHIFSVSMHTRALESRNSAPLSSVSYKTTSGPAQDTRHRGLSYTEVGLRLAELYGLFGYFWRFIGHIASIGLSLSELLKNDVLWRWTAKRHKAIMRLKVA
ncbi:unnamed protein product [Phytophthora fragariaefolia]|uniref:Unnamed protein product n=1 Tax=Phytophthora fragariaefolia TaxID=1490495 RepID=A0A9W7CP27_9STRA|nr:unnamed protein product [Phytophthora fragariaefolia]